MRLFFFIFEPFGENTSDFHTHVVATYNVKSAFVGVWVIFLDVFIMATWHNPNFNENCAKKTQQNQENQQTVPNNVGNPYNVGQYRIEISHAQHCTVVPNLV